jgi:uncharacterized membrane protein
MKHIFRGILILLCIFIILSVVFRPKVLRENHGGGGGHGGGGHGGGGHGGGRGWGGGWSGGSYAVNPLYIYDDYQDYEDDVYYSYPYYFF